MLCYSTTPHSVLSSALCTTLADLVSFCPKIDFFSNVLAVFGYLVCFCLRHIFLVKLDIFTNILTKLYNMIPKKIKEAKTADEFKDRLKGWIWEDIH